MAKDALVSEKMAKNFAKEKDSPYVRWVEAEGLDIIAAHYIPDLNTRSSLKPWERRRGRGVFINHEASGPPMTAMSARSRPEASSLLSVSCLRR